MIFVSVLVLLLSTTFGFAAETALPELSGEEQAAATGTLIYAFGGKELLEGVFQTLSNVLYGKGSSGIESSFRLLVKLALIIGAFCALCLAFFRQKFEPLIRSFFLPGIAIVAIILLPRTTIAVYDSNGHSSKEITVPYFLGKFASTTSRTVHKLQTLFDGAGNSYPWTEALYEERNFFRQKEIAIQDPLLEKNLREYCRECVFRDLGLGLYTKKELRESKNLLQFFEDHSSSKRMMFYEGSMLSCQKAIGEIKTLVEKEAESWAKKKEKEPQLLLRDAVTDKDENPLKELIAQKIVIDMLNEKEESRDLTALAAFSLLAMRNFLEAVLYLAFPVILLLSLLSFGIRTLLSWVKLILWVSLWPIFYFIVDLFLTGLWNVRSRSFGLDSGLSLETAIQGADLYQTLQAVACIALVCIPILCWFLIQGGSAQMIHLTSTLLQSPQASAPPKIEKSNRTVDQSDQPRQTYNGMIQK